MRIKTRKRALLLAAGLLLTATTGSAAALAATHHGSALPGIHADAATGCDPAPMPSPTVAPDAPPSL